MEGGIKEEFSGKKSRIGASSLSMWDVFHSGGAQTREGIHKCELRALLSSIAYYLTPISTQFQIQTSRSFSTAEMNGSYTEMFLFSFYSFQ